MKWDHYKKEKEKRKRKKSKSYLSSSYFVFCVSIFHEKPINTLDIMVFFVVIPKNE